MVYLAEIMYGALMGLWYWVISKWKKSVAELGNSKRLKIYVDHSKIYIDPCI